VRLIGFRPRSIGQPGCSTSIHTLTEPFAVVAAFSILTLSQLTLAYCSNVLRQACSARPDLAFDETVFPYQSRMSRHGGSTIPRATRRPRQCENVGRFSMPVRIRISITRPYRATVIGLAKVACAARQARKNALARLRFLIRPSSVLIMVTATTHVFFSRTSSGP